MPKRKRKARVVIRRRKRLEIPKPKKVTALERELKLIEDKIDSRIGNIKKEKAMVKAILRIVDDSPKVGIRVLAAMYDIFFRDIEPNYAKRRAKLIKLFNLRPNVNDASWVQGLKIAHKQSKSVSYKLFKNGTTKIKRSDAV
jgi:hypothetical protein